MKPLQAYREHVENMLSLIAYPKETRTAGFIRCDILFGTFCSFSFVGWTNRPTDRHFDVIYELSLTVSWSMSNFVVIGAKEMTFFVVQK